MLMTDVDGHSRELLYRLSLLAGSFRRERALAVARIAESVPHPGDAFERLVGPWIERLDQTFYRVSPLVSRAGADANDPRWVMEMHASIADAMLTVSELSPTEASEILFQSILGRNGVTLVRFIFSLQKIEDHFCRFPGRNSLKGDEHAVARTRPSDDRERHADGSIGPCVTR
jgi:hypothetical protein